ncbi:DUF3237 domain-containing protein [Candidatus Poriferisodalis sp.]|uniref:DUF3237 domain-containing protein n=1 Tax=Candidatus Poriferisodalis sp. TaxID=3101277 RepID=UPI003B02D135
MSDTSLPVRHLFRMDIDADLSNATRIRGGPAGTRMVASVDSGTVTGERINGTILGPSGDWLYRSADGTMHLDVRISIRTNDDVDILMEYQGKIYPDGSPRSAPTFQTSMEGPYNWLNKIQAIGIGSIDDGKLAYEVYELL